MRPDDVVVTPPGVDQDLGLGQAEDNPAVQPFIADLAVEARAMIVFPRLPGSMQTVLAPAAAEQGAVREQDSAALHSHLGFSSQVGQRASANSHRTQQSLLDCLAWATERGDVIRESDLLCA